MIDISSIDSEKFEKAFEFVFAFIYKVEDLRLPKFWKNHF